MSLYIYIYILYFGVDWRANKRKKKGKKIKRKVIDIIKKRKSIGKNKIKI